MPFNKIKIYPDFLELIHLNEGDRTKSLRGIFDRDIVENTNFNFRTFGIWPLKTDRDGVLALFTHLTCEDVVETNPDGSKYKKRYFEIDRSVRLHWILPHIEENTGAEVEIFSAMERDIKNRKDVIKTYIFNKEKKYVVVLLPQRTGRDYYLLTAYHLNRKEGMKSIMQKLKNKLPEVH